MRIVAPCVVSLTWLPAVETAIAGRTEGFRTQVQLEPKQAFGDYEPALVCFEARELFPDEVEPGMQFDGLPEGAQSAGMPRERVYTVTEVYPDHVVLDGNHPLAGIALRLDLTVRAVRAASAAECEAGSVADPLFSVLAATPGASRLH